MSDPPGIYSLVSGVTSWSLLQALGRYAWHNPISYRARVEGPLMAGGIVVGGVGLAMIVSGGATDLGVAFTVAGGIATIGGRALGWLRDIFPPDPVE